LIAITTEEAAAGTYDRFFLVANSPKHLTESELMSSEQSFKSDRAPDPVGLYPHARRVGELLFLSGIGPREKGATDIPGVTLDVDGNIVSYDIAEQCHSVFRNVRYILEDAGSSWEKLVDVTVFLTNMQDDFPTFNRIYADYFSVNPPCRTTVEVSRLPTKIAVEVKCIATI
jgi:2-aminomuconate deaminase